MKETKNDTPLLTRDNHFKYYYNGVPFSFRKSEDDVFAVSHGPVSRPVKSWREECLLTAQEIYETYPKPINVLLSGGMDSEVVVRSFVESGINIQVNIIEFEDGLNKHDIQFAFDACAEMKITPKIIPLNIRKFWKNEVWDYADLISSPSPMLATLFWASDQLDGTVVIGGGDGYFKRNEGSNVFYEWETEVFYSLYRWFVKRKRDGVPAFFQYNSEQMLAFMLDQAVLNFVRDGKSRRLLSTRKIKHEIYSRHFKLAFRNPSNGYENLAHEEERLRKTMREKYPGATSVYKMNHYKYMMSFGVDLQDQIQKYFVNFESLEF